MFILHLLIQYESSGIEQIGYTFVSGLNVCVCVSEYRYPLAAVSSVMIILITYRANNIIVNRLITLSGSDRILVKLYFVIPNSTSSLHIIANQILGKYIQLHTVLL